jgi:hypothetical protein
LPDDFLEGLDGQARVSSPAASRKGQPDFRKKRFRSPGARYHELSGTLSRQIPLGSFMSRAITMPVHA